jgi:MFS family permease
MTILDLLRRHPRYLSFGFLHFFFSAVGQTFFISLFVADMTVRMAWGDGTFAGIYSAVTLAAAFALPFIGTLVDRHKVRYVSTVTALALIIGSVTLGLTTNIYGLVAALLIVRLGGQGVMTLIGSTVIGRYFNEGRGKALSASIIGISVAEVILPPAVVWLMVRQGYTTVWLVAAATLLVVFIPAIWLLIRRNDNFQRADTVAAEHLTTASDKPEQVSWTRTQVLRDRRFQLLIPAFIFIPFVFTGLVFNQSAIAAERGYTASWMALGLSAYGLSKIFCLLTAGSVSDRFGPGRMLRFVYLPVLLGLLCLTLMESRLSIPVFFVLIGITAGMESVIWPSLWADRYGPLFLGSIKSTVRFLVVLASASAPVIFSFGLGLGLQNLLLGLIGYGLLCVVLVWVEYGFRE